MTRQHITGAARSLLDKERGVPVWATRCGF